MQFVIVVDTQVDFMSPDGALPVAGAEALVAPMHAWLATLEPAETAGVLFTFDTHYADTYAATAEAALFPIHCVRDTPGWSNMIDASLLDPAIAQYRLEKGVFDMWAEYGLMIVPTGRAPIRRDRFFADLKAAGTARVTVIGVAADYCVRWALNGLVDRGFACAVPADLTRGIDRQIEAVIAEDFANTVRRPQVR